MAYAGTMAVSRLPSENQRTKNRREAVSFLYGALLLGQLNFPAYMTWPGYHLECSDTPWASGLRAPGNERYDDS